MVCGLEIRQGFGVYKTTAKSFKKGPGVFTYKLDGL